MSVLVIRSGGLGDCLLTLPVIHLIGQHHVSAPVAVLGNTMMCDVAGLTRWIDACHDIDDPRFVRLYSDASLTDELVQFFTLFTHVYCFSSITEPVRLADRIRSTGADFCKVFDPRPPESFTGHILDHLMSILPGSADTAYPVDAPKKLIDTICCEPEPLHLVIHPGSGSMAKNWPIERFCEVEDQWHGEVTVILGPAEIERGYREQLTGKGLKVVSTRSIRELAECVSTAAVFLGNDSGSAHLAGLLGIPSVVLFGPTDQARWRPLGGSCVPLRASDMTLEGIAVDEVINALTAVSAGQY